MSSPPHVVVHLEAKVTLDYNGHKQAVKDAQNADHIVDNMSTRIRRELWKKCRTGIDSLGNYNAINPEFCGISQHKAHRFVAIPHARVSDDKYEVDVYLFFKLNNLQYKLLRDDIETDVEVHNTEVGNADFDSYDRGEILTQVCGRVETEIRGGFSTDFDGNRMEIYVRPQNTAIHIRNTNQLTGAVGPDSDTGASDALSFSNLNTDGANQGFHECLTAAVTRRKEHIIPDGENPQTEADAIEAATNSQMHQGKQVARSLGLAEADELVESADPDSAMIAPLPESYHEEVVDKLWRRIDRMLGEETNIRHIYEEDASMTCDRCDEQIDERQAERVRQKLRNRTRDVLEHEIRGDDDDGPAQISEYVSKYFVDIHRGTVKFKPEFILSLFTRAANVTAPVCEPCHDRDLHNRHDDNPDDSHDAPDQQKTLTESVNPDLQIHRDEHDTVRPETEPTDQSLRRLTNAAWLERKYVQLESSVRSIATELDTRTELVATALKSHDIAIRGQDELQSPDMYDGVSIEITDSASDIIDESAIFEDETDDRLHWKPPTEAQSGIIQQAISDYFDEVVGRKQANGYEKTIREKIHTHDIHPSYKSGDVMENLHCVLCGDEKEETGLEQHHLNVVNLVMKENNAGIPRIQQILDINTTGGNADIWVNQQSNSVILESAVQRCISEFVDDLDFTALPCPSCLGEIKDEHKASDQQTADEDPQSRNITTIGQTDLMTPATDSMGDGGDEDSDIEHIIKEFSTSVHDRNTLEHGGCIIDGCDGTVERHSTVIKRFEYVERFNFKRPTNHRQSERFIVFCKSHMQKFRSSIRKQDYSVGEFTEEDELAGLFCDFLRRNGSELRHR